MPVTALGALRRNRIRTRHQQLVHAVLHRAAGLSLEVPIAVNGTDPALVTYHPTGRVFAVYRDLQSYKSAAERGEHGGRDAHYGEPPPPVGHWSDDELQAWLASHPQAIT